MPLTDPQPLISTSTQTAGGRSGSGQRPCYTRSDRSLLGGGCGTCSLVPPVALAAGDTACAHGTESAEVGWWLEKEDHWREDNRIYSTAGCVCVCARGRVHVCVRVRAHARTCVCVRVCVHKKWREMRANFRVEFVFLVESLERSEILFEESNVLLQERVAKCLEEGEREKEGGRERGWWWIEHRTENELTSMIVKNSSLCSKTSSAPPSPSMWDSTVCGKKYLGQRK